MDVTAPVRQQIAAWATPDRKSQFAALAASRGLSESKLLGLLIDSVLERNPNDEDGDERYGEAGEGDPAVRRVPRLADLASGDQVALVGHDLLAALEQAPATEEMQALGVDVAAQLAALRRSL